MHKTEHSTPFLKKIGHIAALIALVAATLVAPASIATASEFPSGYPKMGKSSESITGYNVGSGHSSYRTALFPVYTHPSSAADHFAYCVEISVGTRYQINLNVGGWDIFPGDNNFRHDQLVREKAAWIANNSFPKRELSEIAENAGIDVSRLTEKEAITATQAAIWSYTDGYPARTGFKYTKLAYENGKPVSSDKQERINKLFDYLTGSANTGRPEVLAPTLNVNSPAEAGKAGTRVGPIVIDASEDFVTVTTDTDYIVVDADGNQVDLNKVPGKSALYVEVPQDALTGTATFNVALTGSRYSGQLLTNVKSRTQSLIISQSDTVNLSAAARVDWKRGVSIATTARSGDAGKAEGGNAKFLVAGNEATVVDLVEYAGLTPGVEHELQGELMIRDGDNAVATGITASTTFTPAEESGTVELTFAVDAAELNGEIIVAFETVLVNGEEVAAHRDIFDESQTVYRPAIETDAFDLVDSDQVLDFNGGTLRDRISYEGLRVGSNYVARGVIMDQATGESTGVIAETVFTATTPDGYVDVDFEVPAGHAGRVLVVFEELYLLEGDEPAQETLVASHKDIMDGRQTVTVAEEPVIEEPPAEEPPAEPEEPGKEVPPVEEPPAEEPLAEEPPVEEEPNSEEAPNSDEEPADEETPVVEVLGDVIEDDNEDENAAATEESDEDDDLAATGFGIGAPVILTGSLLILAGAGLVIARRRNA